MATRYLVGGGSTNELRATGNTNWGTASGVQDNASVPGAKDDIIVDGAGVGGNGNFTLTGNLACKSITITSGYSGNITHSGGILSIYGSVSFNSSGQWTDSGGVFNMRGAVSSNLTTNGVVLYDLYIGSTGEATQVTLQTALTTSSRIRFIRGTFANNGYSISTPYFELSDAYAKTFNFTGGVTISLSRNGVVWNADANTTVTAGGGYTYTIDVTSSGTPTFTGDNETYYNLKYSGGGTITLGAGSTFNDLYFTGTCTCKFTAGGTTYITTLSRNTGTNIVTLKSTVDTTAWTLSCASGTITAHYMSIRDCTATGGATFDASDGTNTDVSGNSGWNFTAASTFIPKVIFI